jgi:hypothetical protein
VVGREESKSLRVHYIMPEGSLLGLVCRSCGRFTYMSNIEL